MSDGSPTTEQVPGFCALCISRCGAIATVENGRFVALNSPLTKSSLDEVGMV